MNVLDAINIVCSILAGLCICIPMLAKLIAATREAVRAKNWPEVVAMVFRYMTLAEELFETGESRKIWVMKMLNSSAAEVNYTITDADWAHISEMIDNACTMAHMINAGHSGDAAEPETAEE